MSFDSNEELFVVLINDEEQYSLWLARKNVPDGWKMVSGPAPKSECLGYVEKHWRDMRPRSLREAMGGAIV